MTTVLEQTSETSHHLGNGQAPATNNPHRIDKGDDDDDDDHDKKGTNSTATTITTTGQKLQLADIIGEFGIYQLSLALLAFVRYTSVALMANSGPLIAPTIDYWCLLPDSTAQMVNKPANTTLDDYLKGKCYVDLKGGSRFECSEWRYNLTEHGNTLTDTFNLVCDRYSLQSIFQSTVSVGVVVASVVWGSFSDRHGRNLTTRICFFCSLVGGIISYLAGNFLLYSISRLICSFGDLGLAVSITTTMVETLGNKYRGTTCIIVYTGWALGVMIMPSIVFYFKDYRQLMLFLTLNHLVLWPWLMTIGESIRWSLVNGREEEAREEVRRICRWNGRGDSQVAREMVDAQFEQFKARFAVVAERNKAERAIEKAKSSRCQLVLLSMFGGLSKVNELFRSRELAIQTGALIWTTFNCELLYMLFILINSDIGDNLMLNYYIGGIMELAATLISIVIISSVTRKLSLSSTLVTISCLCFVLAFTHDSPTASIWILNMTKLAISTLSSILYVVTTEMFPTNLRQTGFGLSGTLGSFGAVLAPFVRTELVHMIGMTNMLLMVLCLPLSAGLIIPFFLRETKGVELSDDVDEIVENENCSERRGSSSLPKLPPLPPLTTTMSAAERI